MATRERGRGRSRGGVFRLNGGASTFGRSSSLSMNAPGGSFMSGRPAGGGGGDPIARALAFQAPQASVQGPVSSVGPPPVTPSAVTPDARPDTPSIPSFTAPSTTSQASGVRTSLFPSFQPVVQPAPRLRYF